MQKCDELTFECKQQEVESRRKAGPGLSMFEPALTEVTVMLHNAFMDFPTSKIYRRLKSRIRGSRYRSTVVELSQQFFSFTDVRPFSEYDKSSATNNSNSTKLARLRALSGSSSTTVVARELTKTTKTLDFHFEYLNMLQPNTQVMSLLRVANEMWLGCSDGTILGYVSRNVCLILDSKSQVG